MADLGYSQDIDDKASPADASPSDPQSRSSLRDGVTTAAYFLLQRLALGSLVLLAIIFVSYLGFSMIGETTAAGTLPEAATEAATRTVSYVGRLLQGELGSTTEARPDALSLPVAEVLPAIMGRSLGLLGLALAVATVVGVVLGIRAATHRQANRSLTILLASIIGVSAPSFFVALMLQLLALQWTRTTGTRLLPLGGFGWDKHVILPLLVLAARPIAQITRVTYLSVGEVSTQDFVRTARSKGLRGYQVVLVHTLRNAAVPILTTVGLSLRFSLSSLPVVEFFFGWPGAGFTLLQAISSNDVNLTIALLLSLGALFIVINVLLEGAYRLIDPRLRELPDYIGSHERKTVKETAGAVWEEVVDLVRNNPLSKWLRGLSSKETISPYRAILDRDTGREHRPEQTGLLQGIRWRAWWQGTAGNLPFVLGSILMLLLLAVFLFGPQLAPHSPYTTQGLEYRDGEFSIPPFEPGAEYPWGTDVLGRDMMSLILAGAQQTLLLAMLVVLARTALGFLLGAVAGWRHDSWLDRLILGTAETIAAFPTLLLAMIFILALDIRRGFPPFLIALSLIGWGEMMQFVRGEVMSIRPKPFIESAIAVGAHPVRIVMRHVLPNLITALISLAALEMGAVLILLGELGFIGIFIGGGAFAELDVFGSAYHYSDVPEWGALLSNVRAYARAYPWTATYPALAFFVAILAFNLFGEGLRRLIKLMGTPVQRLFNRYTLAAVIVLAFGVRWAIANSGPMGYYREQAAAFEGERAMAHVEYLADPALEGRALDSDGLTEAAHYVADEFARLGLQRAGEEQSYFQNRSREYERLTATPQLVIDDGGPEPAYREDFVAWALDFRNIGEFEGPVRFLAMGELSRAGSGFVSRTYPALRDRDYSGEALLVASPEDVQYLQRVPRGGLLVVAEDERMLARNDTLSAHNPITSMFGTGRNVGQDVPMLLISEEVANRLLQDSGFTVEALRRETENLAQDELFSVATGVSVQMAVTGTVETREPVANVVGHLPGTSAELDEEMIIVMAQYDQPPTGVGGEFFPGANDNASGIGVMLELIRTLQETGYQPYKTFLFVAYAGEGTDMGNVVYPPDPSNFLDAKYGFSSAFEIEAVVDLRGLGNGTGDRLSIVASGSRRLADVFEEAGRRTGVGTVRTGENVDLSTVFRESSAGADGQPAPQVGVTWEGWEATSRTAADTIDTVSADTMEEAGHALALALMTIGRETNY